MIDKVFYFIVLISAIFTITRALNSIETIRKAVEPKPSEPPIPPPHVPLSHDELYHIQSFDERQAMQEYMNIDD